MPKFEFKQFFVFTLIVSIWVNLSEVFRYFVILMPATRQFLKMVPDVAPMNWAVFSVWGVWDTILTASLVFMYWLMTQTFGNTTRSILLTGTAFWSFLFLLFWIGMCNMGLAEPKLALIALPLAWFEMVVACFITSHLYARA